MKTPKIPQQDMILSKRREIMQNIERISGEAYQLKFQMQQREQLEGQLAVAFASVKKTSSSSWVIDDKISWTFFSNALVSRLLKYSMAAAATVVRPEILI